MSGTIAEGGPKIARRTLLCAGALVTLAAARGAVSLRAERPRLSDAELEKAIPSVVGAYNATRGTDLIMPSRDELSAKIYDAVLGRLYETAAGEGVMLAIAYGHKQDYGLMLHRPEWCYPQQGFEISPTEAVPLSLGERTIPARFLSASRDDRHEQILYWTRIGDEYPQTPRDTRNAVLRETLAAMAPDGVLFRLSVRGKDAKAALPRLVAFQQQFAAALSKPGAQILFGSA